MASLLFYRHGKKAYLCPAVSRMHMKSLLRIMWLLLPARMAFGQTVAPPDTTRYARQYDLQEITVEQSRRARLSGISSGRIVLHTEGMKAVPSLMGMPDVLKVLELIPGMKEQKIQSWCEWLHMDTVELTGATCEIAWENGFKLNFVECCFTITPVATYEFAVTCDYFPLSGQCRLNGKTTQAIELKTLLEAFGVQRSHLSFLPDLTVDDCEFTANPSQHAYNVHTDIRLETAAEVRRRKEGVLA